MPIKGYLDVTDLLILSYYDRLICFDKNHRHYKIVNLNECPTYKKDLTHLLKSLKNHKNIFLVEMDPIDIQILHQWGHGLDINQNQITWKNKPYFGQTGGAKQLEYVKSNLLTGYLKTALRLLIKTLKVGAGVGAVIASGGAGGDTIVGAITATIDSGMFFLQLINAISEASNESIYLKRIFEIKFDQGPEAVHKKTLEILHEMVNNGHKDQLDIICPTLMDLLQGIANVVGDWISTFLPDSAGIVGSIIESIISNAKADSYKTLTDLFNILPAQGQDMLKDSKKLNDFLVGILQFLQDSLTKDDETLSMSGFASRFIKSTVTSVIPGMRLLERSGFDKTVYDKIFGIIKQYYEPNISKAVKVVDIVMPLLFATLTVNEFCIDESKLENLSAMKSQPYRELSHDKLKYNMGNYIGHLKSLQKFK